MPELTEIDRERLLLDCDTLPSYWHFAYGITDDRRKALLQKASHPDSFFKPTSETAMTVFMLGKLEGWEQSTLINDVETGNTPRKRDGA
jgi:hypothetical protein